MSAKKVEAIAESGTESFIPLNKLKKSPKNARKTPHSEASIEAYAASIAAKGILQCESAPKWDPFSSPGKHLIFARKFVRGGVPVGADRDPCRWRAFSVRSATYAEISRGSTSVLIHTRRLSARWPDHADCLPGRCGPRSRC